MGLLEQVDSPKALRALDAAVLPVLCHELRAEIVSVCGQVGGHLGASLGAVELIVALHRVFKSPVDRLVFDVGHQAYAHKLLTGRRARFGTIRQEGGLSPFLDPAESEHDAFGAGHACTALSVSLGILEAKRAQQQPGDVVAVVGDGALTGGLTFEALNHAGTSAAPVKLVLNDNGMSITKNVGAVEQLLRVGPRPFFESLGFAYVGPVDGHDLEALHEAFVRLSRCEKPMVVHAVTQKGRGFAPAEADPRTRGHAMGPYELRDGKLVRSRQGQHTWSDAFAAALEARLESDPRVAIVTPAMLEGSSLSRLAERFPSRVHDVGIAEQHAVTFAAGLAHAGLKPVVCIYSTFLQRAYDQLVHDVVLPRLPVVFAVDRAGLVGADGATHQGMFDLSFGRALPGLTVTAPVWGDDVGPLLDEALGAGGPTLIRFPRGTLPTTVPPVPVEDGPTQSAPLSAGRSSTRSDKPGAGARWLQHGEQVTLVAFGSLVLPALDAAAGQPWAVVDVRRLPLHPRLVEQLRAASLLVTLEEGTTRGGLGAAVLEAVGDAPRPPRVKRLGLPEDTFVRHGEARAQRAALGLDAPGIRRAVQEALSA